MANNEFAKKLIEILLSWIRLVTSWVWNFFQADMAGGFLNWFADNWLRVALALIVVGVIVDWLIWMIRWRPYWLWLRKRQIIYEEVDAPRRPRPAARPEPVRHMPRATAQNEYDDPFAAGEIDPYALVQTPAKPANDPEDWEAAQDPYADAPDDSSPARPAAKRN